MRSILNPFGYWSQQISGTMVLLVIWLVGNAIDISQKPIQPKLKRVYPEQPLMKKLFTTTGFVCTPSP